MRTRIRVALVLLSGGLSGGGAAAQVLSTLLPSGVPGYGTAPGVTVASRLRPETQPQGLRSGAFVFHPRLEQGLGYDSAPLGIAGKGSAQLTTRPSLQIGTTWSRHAFGAYFAVDDTRDLDAPNQSRTDWTASLGGAVDIGRDRLTLSAAHLTQHQDRTQIGALVTDRPVAFQLDDARASYAVTGGRWTLTPSLQVSTWHFSDTTLQGARFAQAYRDRSLIEGAATLQYELAPRRDLLLVSRALGQHYLHRQPGQPERDSTGYQVLFGFADDDGMWRYRVLFGGETRHFAAATYRTHSGPVAEAELAWNVSGMTTLTATVGRRIEDAAQEGIAGYTYTAAKLALDHEYRRNLILHASAAVQQADFLQGGGSQTGYAIGLGATWLLSRTVHLAATYGLSERHGGSTASYTRHLALLTLRLGM